MTDPDELAARAGQTLAEMAELLGETGRTSYQRRWDRLVDAWLADAGELAQSEQGRAAVAALMTDPRPTVRLWSAAAVLHWDPEAARPVLVAIRDYPLDFDQHSITAKHTLLGYDDGTLVPGARLPGT